MHISKVHCTTISSIDRTSNHKQPVFKPSFTGRTHKSVDRFFHREFTLPDGNELSILQSIKDIVSKLHENTVLKVVNERNIYWPLEDTTNSYVLYAVNKKFLNSKCRIATVGCKSGLFSGETVSFINDNKESIEDTLPHVDEIFVQYAKNVLSFKDPKSEQTIKKKRIIEEFAKSVNIDPTIEIDVNKFNYGF